MSTGPGTLTAALRQVVNQVLRLLEEDEAAPLLREGGPLATALATWRASLGAIVAQPDARQLRELEDGKLELAGRVAVLQKECADLRARNTELLEQIVQLNQRQQGVRKEQLEQQLQRDAARAEAKRLDLERRDLARRVVSLEKTAPQTDGVGAPAVATPVVEAPRPSPPGDARGAPVRRRRRAAVAPAEPAMPPAKEPRRAPAPRSATERSATEKTEKPRRRRASAQRRRKR